MPVFNLSDAQVAKLIRFLRAGIKALKYDTTPIKGNIEAGQYTYEQYCQRCHGVDLKGEQGTVNFFLEKGQRSFTTSTRQSRFFIFSRRSND
ncbi:cytochrome c [Abyssogena phaseoliformis symbiont]|uniref:cytochrome c n=1 Tax=Abyssogena phaseoliformis symbiont TaxID=596095 RepID=UPI001915D874|nr:c-type cytochrome [Abyssogena phaseoliformis symbiont]